MAARKLVAEMMDDETTCEYGTEDEYILVWFAACLMECWVSVVWEKKQQEPRGDVPRILWGEEE